MSTVGIDFGTTNSVVSVYGTDGPEALRIDDAPAQWEQFGFGRVMPSVFARHPDGTGHFGWSAKLSGAERFEAVKRLFATQQDVITSESGSSFAVEEVATMLFAQLKSAAAAQGVDARQAVVTVPANSRGLARHRTKICGGMGGFDVLALINEPTAAAMAYAAQSGADGQLLVFDWGGGTLDVTVLRATQGVFLEQASKGLPTRGGLDFDSRLRRAVMETVGSTDGWSQEDRRELQQVIELAKIRLSRDESAIVQLPDGDTRKVTRAMFEDAVESLIEEARHPIEQCLEDLGAGVGAIDAVVMVGGTSNIPAVRNFVADVLGQAPASDVDPMTAIADGAAIAAGILTGEKDDNDFFVATEHALGTVTFSGFTEDGTPQRDFSVLIPRNHKLPARKSHTYSPVLEDQEQVQVRVVEGDPSLPLEHPDNVELKTWSIELPGEPGSANRAFEITYDYDVDGVLHVTVRDEQTGELMLQDDVAHGVSADKRALVQIAKRAKDVVDGGVVASDESRPDSQQPAKSDPEAAALLQQAYVKVIPFLDDEDAAAVRDAADRLSEASGTELDEAKAQLADQLQPYSYLF